MQNTSGRHPLSWLVLIKMDPVAEKLGSGIIAKTEHATANDELAQTCGVVVEIGPLAWSDKDEQGVPRAKVGDHIMIHKHVGQYFEGDDKEKYRVVTDKDILCRVGDKK